MVMRELGELNKRSELNLASVVFGQWAKALCIAKGDVPGAISAFQSRWPRSVHLEAIKSAVDPGKTQVGNWGAPLSPLAQLGVEFISYLQPRVVLGKLAGIRRVPFNVKVPRATAGTTTRFVGNGMPTAVTKMQFDSITLEQSKISGIVVINQELAQSSDPSATEIIRNDLTSSIVQTTDESFLDPTLAEVPNVSPASITHGAVFFPSSGAANEIDIDNDLELCIQVLVNAEIPLSNPFWIMNARSALLLAKVRGVDGARAYPNINVMGGDLVGIPVIVSTSAGNNIVLLDASQVLLADGGVELDTSGEASLEIDSSPSGSAGSTMTSLWQSNLVGLKATRWIRWALRHPEAVSYISGFGGS